MYQARKSEIIRILTTTRNADILRWNGWLLRNERFVAAVDDREYMIRVPDGWIPECAS